ncbi:MAG TPA: hypothetical protein VNJ01_02345 [Bacteriovoracaceae bacterium]|nr:hypothetical protein [Bacteriovoracaceae bacterium]
MKSFLINGCYDPQTLRTLLDLGIQHFGFDLRGFSPNLIAFHRLKDLLAQLPLQRSQLVFQNDKPETVLSFLDMLRSTAGWTLQFRDQLTPEYYRRLNFPFVWMFHPDADWENIFKIPTLEGVMLPVKWKNFYSTRPEVWAEIDQRQLDVYLHADSFEEASCIEPQHDLKISIDLSLEIEKGFRTVDQELLKKLKIWSFHENLII